MIEDLSWVINFANSIVGVGVLAIPFCFYKCGVVLALLLVITSATFAKWTCEFLLKTSQITRKNSIEGLALQLLGPVGKIVAEISTIFLLIGTLIAFQVVIGDLAPSIVHYTFGVEETWRLRAMLMMLSSAAIVPLAMMRNVQSLAGMNAMSMGFYTIFILVIILLSLPNFFKFTWWTELHFWQPSGFFHCLPIIFLAFSCQTQVFIMYDAIPEPSLLKMKSIIGNALNLCTTIYGLVGFFGYIAFYEHGIHGDILANFPSGIITQALKTGFWMSVVVSFPLITFPVRAAINSLLFSKRRKQLDIIASASDYIPQDRFMYITLGLISGTLVVGILVPKIETVLSLTGALVGTFVCFVLPAALYLLVLKGNDPNKMLTQVVLIMSILAMITSTVTVISSQQSSHVEHLGEIVERQHALHDVLQKQSLTMPAIKPIDHMEPKNYKIEKQIPDEITTEMKIITQIPHILTLAKESLEQESDHLASENDLNKIEKDKAVPAVIAEDVKVITREEITNKSDKIIDVEHQISDTLIDDKRGDRNVRSENKITEDGNNIVSNEKVSQDIKNGTQIKNEIQFDSNLQNESNPIDVKDLIIKNDNNSLENNGIAPMKHIRDLLVKNTTPE